MSNFAMKMVKGLSLILTALILAGCVTKNLKNDIRNDESGSTLYNNDVITAATITESGKGNYSWVLSALPPGIKKAYSHRDDVVHIMTFQSSKGLEFPYIAVINASFVHKNAQDESEAIPALYVAFTRATRSLLVTCYKENSISRQLTKFGCIDLQERQDDYV